MLCAFLELLLVQHATIQAFKANLTLEATLLVKQLVEEQVNIMVAAASTLQTKV
jgi:hypothetical protein